MAMNMTKALTFAIFSFCLATVAGSQTAPAVRWGRQIVTPTQDSIFRSLVTDSNDGIYLAVSRESTDDSGKKTTHRYLLKYNQKGEAVWTKLLGAHDHGEPLHINVDDLAADDRGHIYVFGFTESTLGEKQHGKYDAFYAQYDRSGTCQWIRQVGTKEHDICTGLDVDSSGNVYIAGYTYGDFAKPNQGKADIFIAAYNNYGTLLWCDQIGTAEDDRVMDLRLGDHNDVYLCGATNGSLSKTNNNQADIIVARYERTGKFLWLKQYGTPAGDRGLCMTIGEQGQVYVGGRTEGNLAYRRSQRGYGDAFLARISETGETLWIQQFGTCGWDKTFHVAHFTDGSGDVLAGGCQYPSGQYCQAFCRRYSPEGKFIWTQIFPQQGSKGGTCGRAVAVDSDNNCYHAGSTHIDQFGTNNGTANIFLVRFDGMPEKSVP